ncbi:hypothetical protein [Treponema sp.]|uniref:hypothetical protein n=3 Tax=Treponema sp. TaxID=166 RepID=UPI00298DFFBC|nr:hypothetical protein [Treponema sp.]MCI6441747.1 hypothetical protein [Spirochaetia bacterium]MDY4133215.1 hypothetical protein [Treponema sp.]
MKKIFMLAAVALFAFGSLFAQDADAILAEVAAEESKEDANATQVIILEDNDLYKELHPKAKNVTLRIDYTPLTGEAIFQYTCVRSSYDKGEAMNVAMAVYQDFAAEHKYKHYRYADYKKGTFGVEKNFKEGKIPYVSYSSRVIFTK